jgi:hypothetical protein
MNAGLASAIVPDGEVALYVKAVAARLQDAVDAQAGAKTTTIQVELLTSDSPLLFFVGGDRAYLSTGAFRQFESEEDLAAALAHVYAHALNKDQLRHDRAQSIDLLVVADVLARSPMTDEEERAADQIGFLIFSRGGWDPAKYADAWSRLGGTRGGTRAAAIRAFAENSPPISAEWRKPSVADRFTFHNIALEARATPNRSDADARLLLRCIKSCMGNDNIIDRTAAIEMLESKLREPDGSVAPVPGPSHVW